MSTRPHRLGLSATESGTYLGNGEWSKACDAGVLEPVNPTTGEVLGHVHASSQADYELIIARARAAFKSGAPRPRRVVVDFGIYDAYVQRSWWHEG